MNRIRRVIAVLSALSLLHLSVGAGNAAACSTADSGHSHRPAGASHAMRMNAPMAAAHQSPALHAAPQQCEQPAPSSCCDAMVGCGAAVAVVVARTVANLPEATAPRVIAARHAVPASVSTAPEPPPPKD